MATKTIISKEEIDAAATQHALATLGESQFNENSDAAKSIEEDFKAGVTFAMQKVVENFKG